MDPGELRNLKEFLLLYNKISEDCFQKCIFDMTTRTLPDDEGTCISTCVQKHINFNHKTMELFSEINPPFQQRKVVEREEEFRKMQEEAKNAATAGEGQVPWYTKVLGIGKPSTSTSTMAPATMSTSTSTNPVHESATRNDSSNSTGSEISA